MSESPQLVCARCHKHPGTLLWTSAGGTLALAHSQFDRWCECCVACVQLDYAVAAAKWIGALTVALKTACQPPADSAAEPSTLVPLPEMGFFAEEVSAQLVWRLTPLEPNL